MARLSPLLFLLAGCQAAPPYDCRLGAPTEYDARIAPILAQRCTSCHGAEKHKGQLALHTPEAIEAGSESGPVIVPGMPEQSELVKRLKLPLAHEDHMPPKDRPQPSAQEIATIERWIARGASFSAEAEPDAQPSPEPATRPAPRLAPADPKALAALERALVHVEKLDPADGRLLVDFSANAPRYGDEELAALLAPVAPAVADLNLARTHAGRKTLALARGMAELARLDLRGSSVGDAELALLSGHARLEELILARTKLTGASLATLRSLPGLKRLFAWDCGLAPNELAALRAERPALVLDAGDRPDSVALEVEPAPQFTRLAPEPKAAGAPTPAPIEALKPVNSCCPVTGAPLDPRYSIVFEGRVIGFCCSKCPAQFWADPERFRSKLP